MRGRFVPQSTIDRRVAEKDSRIARTTEAGRRLMLLIREPRPEARAAGIVAWDCGDGLGANPHELGSAEYLSWEAGWMTRCRENK